MYIPGTEGSEGITTMTLSPSKRYLAVCEKAERALCIIYDMHPLSLMPPQNPKRKKILTSHDCNSREFVSVAFDPHHEKTFLATISAPFMVRDDKGQATALQGDSKLILWMWDKSKCFALANLQYNDNSIPNQVSFNNQDHNVIVVTG